MNHPFEIGKVYSFPLWPAALIQAELQGVKFLGAVSFEIAARESDVFARHVQVYPTLPQGVSRNPRDITYGLFSTPANNQLVIGLPWIKLDQVQLLSGATTTIEIEDCSPEQAEGIRKLLMGKGFKKLKITTRS